MDDSAKRTQKRPKISVVMTAFNSVKYIEDAIESILKQSFQNYEFIIVDDASNDGTEQILNKYQETDERITVITNAKNLGVPESTNKGLRAAKGEYVARQDADDISAQHRFEKQIKFLDEHADFAIVGAGHHLIDEFGRISKTDFGATSPFEVSWIRFFGLPFIHSSVMFRRDIQTENGIFFDDAFSGAADLDFVQRLMRFGSGGMVNEALVKYRMHSENISTKGADKQKRAGQAASFREAAYSFPNIDCKWLNALFRLRHSDDRLEPAEVADAVRGLEKLESEFCVSLRLNRKEAQKIRNLSARWLSQAALKRMNNHQSACAAQILWAGRNWLPNAPQQAAGFLSRRLTRSAEF